jgi:hypothetical protein
MLRRVLSRWHERNDRLPILGKSGGDNFAARLVLIFMTREQN